MSGLTTAHLLCGKHENILFEAGDYPGGHTNTLDVIPVLGAHLILSENRSVEMKLLMAAGILGFLFDTTLVATGVFMPVANILPRPFSPLWMVVLWLNFAATLNVSLAWLRGHYALAAVFGAVGGPLAYYSGAKMGATEVLPSPGGFLVLVIGWGVMTHVLVCLARFFTGVKTPQNI
ncbi:MAG: DUF2878 family protein [Geobacteraceae bacterium]|nr:DUF2878 family protein [Geobacteraceae bacterium]